MTLNAVSPSGKKDRQQPHVPSGSRHGSTSDTEIDLFS